MRNFDEDYKAFVEFTEAEHPRPFNPQFCLKHWAPCPVEGKPGMVVSIILVTEMMSAMPADVGDHSGMNSWMANRTTSYCCELGDEKMDWLWDEVDKPHCGKSAPKGHPFENGRNCWFRPDHEGDCEWENPGSIFRLMEINK
jgi:hypothetical protein